MELEGIATAEAVVRRWPKIARALDGLADAVYAIEHEIDWDLSGDSEIVDDEAFIRWALGRLSDAIRGCGITVEPPEGTR